jgi:hypothetical protein
MCASRDVPEAVQHSISINHTIQYTTSTRHARGGSISPATVSANHADMSGVKGYQMRSFPIALDSRDNGIVEQPHRAPALSANGQQ